MSLLSKIINQEKDLEDSLHGPPDQSLYELLKSKVNFREEFLKLDPSFEIKKIKDSEKLSYFVIRNKDYHF